MMYIHGNNETDKTINVSKIANTRTLHDNSTAAGWYFTVPPLLFFYFYCTSF